MLLNNGCLCCTARVNLVRMIYELVFSKKGKFDHTIIETTGLANPTSIIQTFYAEENIFNEVVTLVDSKHAGLHLHKATTYTEIGGRGSAQYVVRLQMESMGHMYLFLLVVHVLNNLKYADSHEWVKVYGNSATVDITDHAQDHLGDVVYVEMSEVRAAATQRDGFGAVENVKATSDINSPGLVNSSPYENGWIIKFSLSDSDEFTN